MNEFLFDMAAPNPGKNLLPYDGEVFLHGTVVKRPDSDQYYEELLNNVPWKHDEAIIFGRRIVTERKVAWYGDAGYRYRYSGTEKKALPWVPPLAALKGLAESRSGTVYNSCLVNLYQSGGEGVGWHSDGEKTLKPNAAIASISFGAERRFLFRHKETQETVEVWLEHGSLLVMQGTTQSYWKHAIPKMRKVLTPRINLTFRSIIPE